MTRSMTKRQAAARETRQLILAAAKAIYAEDAGIEVPISALARKAGVAEGTVFSHFPDKASILAAALIDEIENTLEGAWAELPAQSSCKEQVLHLARHLYLFYGTRPHMFRLFLKESLFLHGEWGMRVASHAMQFVECLSELVDKAKARREYRNNTDSNLTARNFFALYFTLLVEGLSEETFEPQRILVRLREGIMQVEAGLVGMEGVRHA